MALVCSVPLITQDINPRRHHGDLGFTGGEIGEVPPWQVVEERVYVTVAKEINESILTLKYALNNCGGRKICLLYIHQPAKRIPNSMGIRLPESQVEEHKVREYRKIERRNMDKLLREYVMLCEGAQVQVDVLHDENDSIEKGIVELVKKHSIRKLIMGAAEDKKYSEKMTELKSKKAIFVRSHAPISCQVRFICNGQVVHTRESSPDNSGGVTPHISKWDGICKIRRISSSPAGNMELRAMPDDRHKSPSSVLDVSINVELYDQLEQEKEKRMKAEKDAIDAFRKMHEVVEEHRFCLEQKSSAVELLQQCKRERDELQVERDNALKVAEDLRKKHSEEASNTLIPLLLPTFPLSEIKEATCNFDPSFKIGKGGYGIIYKCSLRHTQVAVKTLLSHSSQGPSEFHHEVNVLTKMRHPNLVSLIGTCPEAWILVYEYCPNGSLEDRLVCRGNTPPLSWQTRIRIAAELCSGLVFLHSCSLVHGDLKPDNILLDANYVCKLGDFGICRDISSQNGFSSGNTTLCWITDAPKGTIGYMDPQFCTTGELTTKSDVYSFGVILLRLLTGIPALGITNKVQHALGKGNLKDLLDRTAGDWPFLQAKKLAHLAMKCCEMNRKERPDFTSEVWKVLEPMRDLSVESARTNEKPAPTRLECHSYWCGAHHPRG